MLNGNSHSSPQVLPSYQGYLSHFSLSFMQQTAVFCLLWEMDWAGCSGSRAEWTQSVSAIFHRPANEANLYMILVKCDSEYGDVVHKAQVGRNDL